MDAEVGYHEETLIQKSDDEYDEDQFAGRVAAESDKIWLHHTQMSGQVDLLFAAMAKAQGEMGHAAKTEENEFYGSKYADLAACFEAIRQPLFMNGLCIIQSPAGGMSHDDDSPASVILETVIGHVSGQWISSSLTMRLVRDDPHGVGSAVTYARRYALTSMLGLAQADDDGNAATVPERESKKTSPAKKKTAKKKAAKKKAVASKPVVVNLGDVESDPKPTERHTVYRDRLNKLLKDAGCTNTVQADSVCAWLFSETGLVGFGLDRCRETEKSAQLFCTRYNEVVDSGVPADEFLTRAAVWRDGTQEEKSK